MKKDEWLYRLYHYSSYFNYIIWLFEMNMLFLLMNLPFAVLIFILDIRLGTLPILYLSSVTLVPSTYAVIRTLKDVTTEPKVMKNFFIHLKIGYKRLLKLSLILLFFLWIMVGNIFITAQLPRLQVLFWLNILFLLVLITFTINFLIVMANWKQTIKETAILTIKLAIVKSIRSNLNFLILIGTFILLKLFPIYLLMFGASVAILLCMINFKPVIDFVNREIEEAA
ncbi:MULTISPECIES: hypothetical protein [Niallia]|jgi:hypothetical protein|uniref:Uncharacterized protein n=1 Tax=Niallia circulans TaxID=1397 RepID=A0A268FEE9_NIACI|nr:hypothetical protein [Niallia circulans]AYV68041.1 hypothetical protein C2I06_14830 [Niallia circulans]AYV73582.1 hypothetical protein C2H98_19585 [Niallia circulans]PAD83745.1 hypothetical protein CHH57_08330 [Niallia circulans]